MAFRLPLAPAETLGRRFQYSFLSLDPRLADVDEARGYAIFKSVSDYLNLVNRALDSIRQMTTVPGTRRRCPQITVQGIDCCGLHRGPSLYAVGRRAKVGGQTYAGDYLTLAQAGFTKCPYTSSTGKATVAWTHAAVSYADLVLSRGSPLGGQALDLPWLAKATLFGKVRMAGGGQYSKAPKPTLDTLGSILLGGSVSFLWSQRLGDSTIEFYLVPDSVHDGFSQLRNLMLSGGFQSSSVARAARLASDYPVSLEVALALTLAEDLASNLGPASQISSYRAAVELEKAATVVTVTPQQRPMVRSVIPLSIAVYAAYNDQTLRAVSATATNASRALKQIPGLRDVIGRCVNSMYLQAVNCKWSDHLSSCIRDLYTAADQAANTGLGQLAAALERLASRLSTDYLALTGKC